MKDKGLYIVFAAVLIAILLSVPAKSFGSSVLVSHAPIFIGNNSSFTPANGVTSGSGTQNNPYIIENWEIDAGSGTGIQIYSTSVYFILRNCKVTNGQWGISLSSVSNGTITGNQCFDYTEAGIYLYSSSNNKVTNNTCSWTKIYSVVDKQWHDASVAWVYSQAYDDWSGGINTYGIDLSGTSQNNLIDGNTCMNNVSCGIHNGWDSSTVHTDYNTISNNYCSSTYKGVSRNGLALYHSTNCTVSNNTFLRGSHTSIKVSDTYNSVFSNNTCNESYNGIYLEYTATGNTLSGNTCNGGKYGICLDYSTCSSNSVTQNTCSSNYMYGIFMNSATGNVLTLNSLSNNTGANAYDSGNNTWDVSGQGNYWSDWQPPNRPDANNDGIVDTARSITGGSNVDHYPLVLGYVPDFTLSVSPTSGSVNQGGSASTTVSLTSVSGFSSTVSLTASGLPSGATATFAPSSGAPSFTSALTISTSLTTPVGSYTITITGTGGGKTHSTTFSLTVTAAPPENMAPTEITVQVENTAENVKITVQEVTEGAAGIVTGAPRTTYKYLKIVAENITDAQIKNVTIRFTVEKSWIAQNRIDKRTITLNHYNSATGKWTPLPTTFLSEDNTHASFSAVSPGLSVFGISGQPIQPDLTISVSPTSGEFVVVIIIVILIVIAVISAIFLYRRKPRG